MHCQALTCMVTCSCLRIMFYVFLSLFLGVHFVKRDANSQTTVLGLRGWTTCRDSVNIQPKIQKLCEYKMCNA